MHAELPAILCELSLWKCPAFNSSLLSYSPSKARDGLIWKFADNPITDCCIPILILMLMFKVYPFMLDNTFLVMYDVHSYSTRDAFI